MPQMHVHNMLAVAPANALLVNDRQLKLGRQISVYTTLNRASIDKRMQGFAAHAGWFSDPFEIRVEANIHYQFRSLAYE